MEQQQAQLQQAQAQLQQAQAQAQLQQQKHAAQQAMQPSMHPTSSLLCPPFGMMGHLPMMPFAGPSNVAASSGMAAGMPQSCISPHYFAFLQRQQNAHLNVGGMCIRLPSSAGMSPMGMPGVMMMPSPAVKPTLASHQFKVERVDSAKAPPRNDALPEGLHAPQTKNHISRDCSPGVTIEIGSKFFGCYWRNKYAHLMGFPEVSGTGVDYETWTLTKGAINKGLSDVTTELQVVVKQVKKKQRPKAPKKGHGRVGRPKGTRSSRSYPSPVLVNLCIPGDILSNSGGLMEKDGSAIRLYAHMTLLNNLPEDDKGIIGKQMSMKDIEEMMGANKYSAAELNYNIVGNGGYNVNAKFEPSQWMYSERVGNINNKAGFTHRPKSIDDPPSASTRRFFTTLRVVAFSVTSRCGTPNEGTSEDDFVYTPIAAVRSAAFVVGTTRTIRRKRQQQEARSSQAADSLDSKEPARATKRPKTTESSPSAKKSKKTTI